MDENKMIEIKNLTKDYGFNRGVFDCNIIVKKGEVYGFLGPNGAGKSTTIRHLMGFSKPDKGLCKILGKNMFYEYNQILNKVGYIPGEIALPQGITGKEFIKMIQDMQQIHNENRLKKMLDIFELKDDLLNLDVKEMSLGIKRKLVIVTAFMHDPDVLILDEPTSGLDPVMQERFVMLIHEEKKRGKTILLSSHIFSEIDETCDKIAIIKDGVIVKKFDANDLKHASVKYYTIKFNNTLDKNNFIINSKHIKSLELLDESEDEVYLSLEDNNLNDLVCLLSNFKIKSFSNKLESLEDFFMKFYNDDKKYGGVFNECN